MYCRNESCDERNGSPEQCCSAPPPARFYTATRLHKEMRPRPRSHLNVRNKPSGECGSRNVGLKQRIFTIILSFVCLPEERTVHAVLISFMRKGHSFRETARVSAALERNNRRGDTTTFKLPVPKRRHRYDIVRKARYRSGELARCCSQHG